MTLSARARGYWAGAAIAAAAAAAYANQWSGAFVMDDRPTIVENYTLRHLRPLGPVLNPNQGGLTVSGRPLASLSLALNYAWGGLNPVGYHAFNLAVHILAALVLFGVLRRTLERFPPLPARLLAFGAALLWAVHPLQTESVTYIVQRTESMMGLFYLLTLYCFIRFAAAADASERRPYPPEGTDGSPSRPLVWASLAALCCLAGMACKEVMVSAPVFVLLYDRTLLSGTFREAWRRRGRFHLALVATWIPLIALAVAAGNRGGTSGFGAGVPAVRYWLAQFPALLRYLGLALWPHPLIFDYGLGAARRFPSMAPAAAVVLALFGGSLWLLFAPLGRWGAPERARRARTLGLAGIWFFTLLAPTSVIPGNRQVMAEHRMYLSLAAVLALAVLAAGRLVRWRPAGLAALVLVWALALGLATRIRNRLYGSELALYADTVRKLPENFYVQCGLGVALSDAGRPDEARAHYEAALRINPRYGDAYDNLGLYYYARGDFAAAVRCYREALQADPGNAQAHNNLGIALFHLGDPAGARAQFERAIALKPQYPDAFSNLGNLERSEGKTAAAWADYERALRLDPGFAKAANNLGVALAMDGRLPEALQQFERAVRLQPTFAEGQNNLGLALLRAGRPQEAVPHLQAAIRLQPNYANAHHNLGLAWRALGRIDEAMAEFENARPPPK